MKRILLLLAIVGMTALQGCSNDDDRVDNDTIAEVFEINQNTNFNSLNNYRISYTLNPPIYNSDMILIYRLDGQDAGQDVWVPLPKTYYFNGGDELDYSFDFSTREIFIYLGFTNSAVLLPEFTQNQVFRVVIIPGFLSNKPAKSSDKGIATPASVDYNDYYAVIRAYGLNDSNIKTLKPSK